MEKYSEYKDSGVEWLGEIPKHWEVLPGKSIYLENKEKNDGNTHNVLSLSYGNIIVKENINDGLVPENYSNYQMIQEGYLIVRCTDLQNDKVSLRTSISNHEGIITGAYLALIPKKNVFPKFLHFLFRNWDNTKELYRYGSGLRQSLSWSDFKNLVLPVPTIEEQIAIANYLDTQTAKIDEAISQQQKMIDLLNERKQIIVNNAVTKGLDPNVPMKDSGVEWIGMIPEHWEIIPMRYLCKIQTGDKDTIMRNDNGKYPFYVRSPKIEHIDTYSFDGEAVLMAGDGVGAGKVIHYALGKFDYHQRVYNFHSFYKVKGKFLYYYLSANFKYKIEEGGAKSTVDSVRLPWLKTFPICVTNIEEQQKVINKLDIITAQIERAITAIMNTISLLQERKQIIINEVVTGKVKVS